MSIKWIATGLRGEYAEGFANFAERTNGCALASVAIELDGREVIDVRSWGVAVYGAAHVHETLVRDPVEAKFNFRTWCRQEMARPTKTTHQGLVVEYKLKDGSTQTFTLRVDLGTGRVERINGVV